MIKNKFAKWIEWLLDLLPLFAVLFSCLYVTFNKNALNSYSGSNTNEYTLETIQEQEQLIEGENYIFINEEYINNPIAGTYNISYFKDENTNRIYDNQNMYLTFYTSNNNSYIQLYKIDTTNVFLVGYTISSSYQRITFTFDSVRNTPNNELLSHTFKLLYEENYYLNNVFTYSLSQFNDLGFDKLNFINWFTGLFLNGTSNVYTTFINGYLNYFLLVECTYVLPMVLYWFIHLGERLISKLEYGGDK